MPEERPSAIQLMSGTREAIAQARKTIADDAMDGCTDVFGKIINNMLPGAHAS